MLLEVVRDLEVIEDTTARQNVFQQFAEPRNVPLAIAQLVDQAARRVRRRDLERVVERLVGGVDAQVGIENQQRIAHGADDRFGIVARGGDRQFAALQVVDVDEHQHRAVDLVVERQVRAHAQGKPAAVLVLHLALARAHGVDDLGDEAARGRARRDCGGRGRRAGRRRRPAG